MRFEYRNRVYEVSWEHHSQPEENDGDPDTGERSTVCFITWLRKNGKSSGHGYAGEAWCHPKDQYHKETGRKLSLGKALQRMKMPKKDRTRVWELYLSRSGFPKEKGPKVSVPERACKRYIGAFSFFRRIDYDLLEKQKATVHKLSLSQAVQKKDQEHLCGIVYLLDDLQDQAVKSGIPEDEVFGSLVALRKKGKLQ